MSKDADDRRREDDSAEAGAQSLFPREVAKIANQFWLRDLDSQQQLKRLKYPRSLNHDKSWCPQMCPQNYFNQKV
jgi:hypothetical protein